MDVIPFVMRMGLSFTVFVFFTADMMVVVVTVFTVVVSVLTVEVALVVVVVLCFVSTTVVWLPLFVEVEAVFDVVLDDMTDGPLVVVLLVFVAGCVTGPTVVVPRFVGSVSDVDDVVDVVVFETVGDVVNLLVGPTVVVVAGSLVVVVSVCWLMIFAAPVVVTQAFWHHIPLSRGIPL